MAEEQVYMNSSAIEISSKLTAKDAPKGPTPDSIEMKIADETPGDPNEAYEKISYEDETITKL